MKRRALHYCILACVLAGLAIAAVVAVDRYGQRVVTLCSRAAAGAQSLFNQGKAEEARAALEEALELAPDNLVVRRELAMQLLAGGHIEDAARELRAVMEVAPQDGEAARKLAAVLTELGDAAGATRWLRRAADLEPTNAMNRVRLARGLLAEGRSGEAAAEAERAVELAWGMPEAHLALGLARLAGGDARGACLALEAAARLRPCDVSSWLLCAAAARDGGLRADDVDEARRGAAGALWCQAARVSLTAGLAVCAGPQAGAATLESPALR
jgi:tetratricopeptide (TPR) repeat protein